MSPIRDRPPAKAIRKNSGKTIEGTRTAGLTSVLWIERQATPRATLKKDLIPVRLPSSSPGQPRPHRRLGESERDHEQDQREAEAERQRLAVPAFDYQAAQRFDQ